MELSFDPRADGAVQRLSALAQGTRLNVFRLLVRAGPRGVRATDIAEALAVPANTLSSHLKILADAGLVAVRPEARERWYAARFETMRDLLAYLMEDCCQGSPEVCGPLAGVNARASSCQSEEGPCP